MTIDAEFSCQCGAVAGRATGASPESVQRIVCYCDDCQAFLHYLGRSELQNAAGGNDIVQLAPASYRFERGSERIRGVRLKPKGLYRWYASCCNTPLGNTLAPGIPFVGVMARIFQNPDEHFGRPRGSIYGQFAIGTPPPGSTRPGLRLLARALGLIGSWLLRGRAWPHPFFDRDTRTPLYPVSILSRSERDALRPRCGPRPSTEPAQPLA